jgi:hypothetical protein
VEGAASAADPAKPVKIIPAAQHRFLFAIRNALDVSQKGGHIYPRKIESSCATTI